VKLVKSKIEVRAEIARLKSAGARVGLVPTMGYFHEGHLSLMRISRRQAVYTVVSLFVNPIQFAPGEDLEGYPRDPERDLDLARKEGVDLFFVPDKKEVYAPNASTFIEETSVSKGLCGQSRPDHFRGVTTVLTKLFNIVTPDLAVFGSKDLQQLMVIRRMVRDLDFPVEIVAGPTVREPDGLALSSRNLYLSKEERRRAPDLYRGLQAAARALAEPGAELASAGQGENVSLRRSVERITGAGCGTGKRVIAMSFSKLKRKSKRSDFCIVDFTSDKIVRIPESSFRSQPGSKLKLNIAQWLQRHLKSSPVTDFRFWPSLSRFSTCPP
jgi:pantoate--beta-alanine ligase